MGAALPSAIGTNYPLALRSFERLDDAQLGDARLDGILPTSFDFGRLQAGEVHPDADVRPVGEGDLPARRRPDGAAGPGRRRT